MLESKHLGHWGALFLLVCVMVAGLASLIHAPRAEAANFTVTSTADSGPGTLRAAVNAANANGEADTITFAPSLTATGDATITLSTDGNRNSSGNTLFPGPSALVVSSRIAIVGSGGENGITMARDAAVGSLRLFYVSESGNLTLENLTLKDGLAKGGDAFGGGGGAAGLGGAVFNAGELRVEASTLSGNIAQGGIGNDSLLGSGGGGGLGGDGGLGLTGEGFGGPPNGGTIGSAGSPDGTAGGDGGGGGGGYGISALDLDFDEDGGDGGFGGFGGGGGGGGGTSRGNYAGLGGNGGFGGGGGSGWETRTPTGDLVSQGGFGGGGGSVSGFIGTEHQIGAGGGGGGFGGAIFNSGGGVTLENSTLSGNAARGGNSEGSGCFFGGCPGNGGGGFGGGLFNLNGSVDADSATLANNTVAGGSGFFEQVGTAEGGGIYSLERTGAFRVAGPEGESNLDLVNTILADNTGDTGCENNGGAASGSGNLIEGNAAAAGACAGVASSSDPNLGPLSDNGGPTATHALLSGSPAIEEGNTALTTDQRGVSRPQGTADDIGAFERGPGILRFTQAGYTENEDAGTVTITVNRTGGTDGEVSVNYATSTGGTANAGQDYTSTSGTLTFANGDNSESFTVPITNDATDEPNETVNLSLSNPSGGATLGSPNTATLTITDDDATPSLSITDETVTEGDSGTTEATFTITLSAASARTVTVDYATQDDSASAPGDYGAASGTLTFAPGKTTEELTIPVSGDEVDESDETFFVNLTNPSNATISDGRGIGTITDDDTAGVTVTPTSGLTTTEAGGADYFTVVLDSRPTSDVTIPLSSSDTTEGTVSPASLTFTPENFSTPQTVTVTGVDDSADDGDVAYEVATEAATSTDANYSGLNVADVSVTNTDDDVPAISIDDASVTEGDSGTTDATFNVTLDRESSQPVEVDYSTSDGTASSPSDYQATGETLTFSPGETETQITVSVRGDTRDERDEKFSVNLSNSRNADIPDARAVGTIEDDDETPPPACHDGKDNDGDGKKDLNDPGCSSRRDDSERNKPDPPACTITGTKGDDTLRGTERRDVICAKGGDDTVIARGGNDIVRGGGGDDTIFGGEGSDTLYGGRGRDTLIGGDGRDRLAGGPGSDVTRQ